MSPYLQAWALLEANGLDPAAVVDRCAAEGYLYAWPEGLIMAQHPPGEPLELIIWLAIGKNCLQRFCQLAPPGLLRVHFARGLRGQWEFKQYPFERIKRLCKTNSPTKNGPPGAL